MVKTAITTFLKAAMGLQSNSFHTFQREHWQTISCQNKTAYENDFKIMKVGQTGR